ncbi:MAG: DUF6364 family protein [Rhodothermaceae bacterium]|nr:DUF6364 family protein [Rhodothermaceae bacterium]
MKEKLTLSIDKKTKDLAKKYAKRRGITVSGMVEHFLRSVSRQEESWQPRDGSVTSKLTGSIPDPANQDYDIMVTEALMQKYGYEKNSD